MKDGPSYACDKKFGMGILCIAINYFQRQNSILTEDAEHSSKFTSPCAFQTTLEDPHWTGKEEIVDRSTLIHGDNRV